MNTTSSTSTLRSKLWLRASLGFLVLIAATSVSASEQVEAHCALEDKGSRVELNKLIDDVRTQDDFYQQLIAWRGAPASCRGSAGRAAPDKQSWLEFAWPDKSTFETKFMPPEIFLVRYERVDGLTQPEQIEQRFREYSAKRGLTIDWTAPIRSNNGEIRIFEYQDRDPGVNGIVRFTYDPRRGLVSVSLSMAP